MVGNNIKLVFSSMLVAAWIFSVAADAGNDTNITTPLNTTTPTPLCNTTNGTDPCPTEVSPTNATIQQGNFTEVVEPTNSTLATLNTTTSLATNSTNSTVSGTAAYDDNTTTSQSTAISTTPANTTTSTPSTTTVSTQSTTKTTESTTVTTRTTTTVTTAEEETTPTTKQTITDRVKEKWKELVANTNFDNSSLNETRIAEMAPSEVIEIIVDYYKTTNQTLLTTMLEESRVDDLATVVLEEVPDVLEPYVRHKFNSSQNISLYGTLASLYWFHDEVLNRSERFSLFLTTYGGTGNESSSNETSTNVTAEGFIRFVISKPTGNELFTSLCKAAEQEGVNASLCDETTVAPPTTTTAPLPGPAKFEATWEAIVGGTYTFLTIKQSQELQSVTPGNMTTSLIQYVNAMTADEVKKLVDQNVTQYVSRILRTNGNTAIGILGREAVDAMNGDTDKEDIFYVYLNFMNNLLAKASKFEDILRGYVNGPSSRRRKRSEPNCDRSTINAFGMCCYVITTEASNVTALRASVCEELQGGDECINSMTYEEPTVAPVPSGLSTGEIVGIALGAFFGLLLIAIILFFLWKRFNRKKSKVNPQDTGEEDTAHDGADSHTAGDGRALSRASTNGQPPGPGLNGSQIH